VAFLEHGGDDIVPGVQIGEQFVEQIRVAAAQPQMMVRVDDRQIRFEDRLRRRFRIRDRPRWPTMRCSPVRR